MIELRLPELDHKKKKKWRVNVTAEFDTLTSCVRMMGIPVVVRDPKLTVLDFYEISFEFVRNQFRIFKVMCCGLILLSWVCFLSSRWWSKRPRRGEKR